MNTILLSSNIASLMGKAGVNTLIGMGTVFLVLIIIMAVIYSFNLFNGTKTAKVENKQTGIDNAVAQIKANEEASDDLELVAVISAAIAAFEGSSSTDGYVVRSIRRVR